MVKQLQCERVYDDPAPYSQGRIHDGTIYLAGLDPVDGDGEIVGDEIETQTTQTLRNVERLLAAADSSCANIVSVTAYLVDGDDFAGFNRAFDAFLPDPKPARTTVVVDELVTDARIERQVIAAQR